MLKLKKISSDELLQELIERKVLEKIEIGIYKPFDLRPKYGTTANYDAVYLFHKKQWKYQLLERENLRNWA